ncbi:MULTISPECIES: hypothetical protein [unclassified Pseudomonas]|uniref:hypothetical protein n=1 Tax=unclassified Pseudomonas TaxID=196821 RepID=UPI002447B063|nr:MULTISPECIES: hypothetical protein [unclassified Pseudomonas]MDG9923344.1 hypothetical protein [Pseudomonas sp. GD04045]MDH0037555.1 hypothetical protein [Pseudomonas sp. GD04019]
MESVTLEVIRDDKTEEVELIYSEQPASVRAIFADGNELTGTGADIFSSFLNLRESLPGCIFQCKGAKINVHPSRMSSQMGGGLIAYELSMGYPAKRSDLVNIFTPDTVKDEVLPAEQREFFKRWIQSLSDSPCPASDEPHCAGSKPGKG